MGLCEDRRGERRRDLILFVLKNGLRLKGVSGVSTLISIFQYFLSNAKSTTQGCESESTADGGYLCQKVYPIESDSSISRYT
jgi:hypothetical protein